ncbi:PilZ domain-containing protein [Oryzomonas japonica]|uniref:PilZ domain-containing protein n=1 Tax=Oryzomonas japonica TaxID=2603858 RepID=A0A7J4ZR77_9BACT|nr:PilZ domain-containing protein [Oryzomonas japonica]
MENRGFVRVDFSGEASLAYNGQRVSGNTGNVSLGGIYFKTTHEVPLNTPVMLTICPSAASSINLYASTVRTDRGGVACQSILLMCIRLSGLGK